jgi:hypothetical protein
VAYALSIFALLFTIGSFWWLHARKGRIVASTPRTYAFHERVRLRLPLVLFNSGATALVVTDLRIALDGDPERAGFAWITTRSTLRPGSEDDHRYATAFAVKGREARELIAEFGDNEGWSPAPGSRHRMRVLALVAPSKEWDEVGSFDWWAPPSGATTTAYIAHRNVPPDDPAQQVT